MSRMEEERIMTFLKDPFIDPSRLGPNRVVCKPCGRRVALSKGRFKLKSWQKHKEDCLMVNIAKEELDESGEWADRSHYLCDPRSEEDIAVDLLERFSQRGLFSPRLLRAFLELGFGFGGIPSDTGKPRPQMVAVVQRQIAHELPTPNVHERLRCRQPSSPNSGTSTPTSTPLVMYESNCQTGPHHQTSRAPPHPSPPRSISSFSAFPQLQLRRLLVKTCTHSRRTVGKATVPTITNVDDPDGKDIQH